MWLQIVEESAQHEILPTGDELELREVRHVTEVVKKVATVKKAAKGASQQVEPETPASEMPRGAKRGGGRRDDTATRLDDELDEALKTPGRPGSVRRQQQEVVIEGDEEDEEMSSSSEEEEEEETEEEPSIDEDVLRVAMDEVGQDRDQVSIIAKNNFTDIHYIFHCIWFLLNAVCDSS